MLAAAVLACRLVCSACQAADPLVLHALPFKLAGKTKLAVCNTLANSRTPETVLRQHNTPAVGL